MSETKKPETRYYIAHVRGPFWERLRSLGFLVLYPALDDYVFLEAKQTNEHLLRKQTDLAISFLKKAGKYQTVSAREISNMMKTTVGDLEVGANIVVVTGHAANLTGTVSEVEELRVRCELKGFNRTYDLWLDRLSVTKVQGETQPAGT